MMNMIKEKGIFMRALLILDMQKGFFYNKQFLEQQEIVKRMIAEFKNRGDKIIAFKHIDKIEGSIIEYGTDGSELLDYVEVDSDIVIEKDSPIAFMNTNLDNLLKKNQLDHLFIVGFNTEYCCMFTSIAARDRGYKVTFIEDGTGTVNDMETYEMPNLDIQDFVGSVLNWSNIIEVLYYEEYVEKYE